MPVKYNTTLNGTGELIRQDLYCLLRLEVVLQGCEGSALTHLLSEIFLNWICQIFLTGDVTCDLLRSNNIFCH